MNNMQREIIEENHIVSLFFPENQIGSIFFRLRHERHRQPLAAAAASALDKHSHTSPGSGNKPIGLTYFDIEEDPEKLNLPNWQNLSKDDPFNKLSNVTSSSITSEG